MPAKAMKLSILHIFPFSLTFLAGVKMSTQAPMSFEIVADSTSDLKRQSAANNHVYVCQNL
jgi:hypothetical protein